MKRAWRIPDSAWPCRSQARSSIVGPYLLTFVRPTNCYPSSAAASTSSCTSTSTACASMGLQSFIGLFLEKFNYDDFDARKDLRVEVTILRKDLMKNAEEPGGISRVLDETGHPLFRSYPKLAFIELLEQLLSASSPHVAIQVLTWRRRQAENGFPITSEEYAKSIAAAGRCKNIDLATELFTEAANEGIKTTITYNALMGAYMYNRQYSGCHEVFRDFKRNGTCKPSTVTFNILISVFGRSMMVPLMESAFKELEALNLSPNLGTYNNLIDGYLVSWKWESMERTFKKMKAGPVKPDIMTHSLMLRGYAFSSNLGKMEEMYELVKYHEKDKLIPLIRVMISAYCRSSVNNRVDKIQALLRLIPEDEYSPWLTAVLIRVYAQEDWLEEMEELISEAFEHKTCIHTVGIMRSIIASYFRCNAVDRLSDFVRRAESAGWRSCRSLYHSKLVMYGSANRLEEMEGVLSEMESFNFAFTKRTFLILYKAYSNCGKRYKVEQVMGLMCKHGHGIPLDTASFRCARLSALATLSVVCVEKFFPTGSSRMGDGI